MHNPLQSKSTGVAEQMGVDERGHCGFAFTALTSLGIVIFFSRKVAKSPAARRAGAGQNPSCDERDEAHDQSWTIPGRIMGNQKFRSKKPMSQD